MENPVLGVFFGFFGCSWVFVFPFEPYFSTILSKKPKNPKNPMSRMLANVGVHTPTYIVYIFILYNIYYINNIRVLKRPLSRHWVFWVFGFFRKNPYFSTSFGKTKTQEHPKNPK